MDTSRKTVLALVGMKHCGKSTLGRLLAARRGLLFCDLDEEIVRRHGGTPPPSVRALYRSEGKERFMVREHEALAALLCDHRQRALVLALGGGVIDNTPAMTLLRESAVVVYLAETPERLFARIMAGGVPAFLDPARPWEDFQRLHAERSRGYAATANLIVPMNGADVAGALAQLEQALQENGHGW